MIWIIGTLTVILVLNSLLLVLLILVQLPKKEAGMGTAFGGGTTDALFGAGTGNALTKITKYCTVVFFVLTLSLSILNAQKTKSEQNELQEAMKAANSEELLNPDATAPVAPDASATTPAPAPEESNPAGSLLSVASNAVQAVTGQEPPATTPPTETPEVPTPAPADPQ